MVLACPREGVLEWGLGCLEHCMVGGEEGEAPLDLNGGVPQDVGRVVGLHVHIMDDLL